MQNKAVNPLCAFAFSNYDNMLTYCYIKKKKKMRCLMSVLMFLPWWLPQHLVQWDAGNPECLLQLVKELIQQYHCYQCQRLRESSRLLFEYDSLLEHPNYGRNMEIYAGRKNSWVGNFFMTLSCSIF